MAKGEEFIDKKIPLYSIIEKLTPYIIGASGGSLTLALTKISELVQGINPIFYAIAFVAGIYIALGIYHIILSAKKKNIILRQANLISRPGEGNPLETKFDKKTIKITDFFSPFYSPHKNKTFHNCEIVGPGNVIFLGCTLNNCILSSCQVVIINDSKIPILNITAFSQCVFLDTKILGSTIFVSKADFRNLATAAGDDVVVISGTP
ncbi:hypothetical protein HFD98_09665 [Pseudomonas sp. EKM23D]|uniref:hypothetical protein n=1 Tax=Pseudomonas sp. EKM23D TaxID=2708062 RepID=UPI00142D88B4|nr:hypothetical protein [Pseudomonas sp. EKM23D]KAF6692762.1 hypothetical protein HFD98_09665 [Pseudomonas sp. EKM23D]